MKSIVRSGCVALAFGYIGFLFMQSPVVEETSERSEVFQSMLGVSKQVLEAEKEELQWKPPYETEVVAGVEVRKDRDCTIEEHTIYEEDGAISVALECKPNHPEKNRHPYADYDVDTLHEMAYGDPVASEILGIRLIEGHNEKEGLQFIYRAVALSSGRSMKAIDRANNTFYSAIVASSPPDWNPQPAIAQMEQAFVFDFIRKRLANRSDSYIRSKLEDVGYQNFVDLKEIAKQILAEMAQIEIDVVGSQSIKEKIDA